MPVERDRVVEQSSRRVGLATPRRLGRSTTRRLRPEIAMAHRIRFYLFILFLLTASASAQTFVFDLRGSQEVPPNGSIASGGCMGTLNQPASQFAITCVHNVVAATIMHIHRGDPGVNGPILFDLGNPTSPVT